MDDGIKGHRDLIFLRVHGSSHCRKQMGVVRCDDLLRGQAQGADKTFPQLGKEVERAS